MWLADLTTPCLVLDKTKLERNAARMRARAADLGVALRPHLKTAKCVNVARIAHGGELGPITVSTLREAEYFADNGYSDILCAVCISPDKLERAAAIAGLTVITDSAVVAAEINQPCLVEVDCGEGRTGVGRDAVQAIADVLGPHFRGVMTHGGHSYGCRTIDQIQGVAEQERASVADFPGAHMRSVGSTPTATHAQHLAGVTEMRPGVYLFGDLFQVSIHSCRIEDIACTVLATVTSHKPERGQLMLDAGGLALSKDRSTAKTSDLGYGLVCDDATGEPIGDLYVADVHQEHGEVRSRSGAELPWERLEIGARVRIMPNHICMTAAMYDRYHLVDGGEEVQAIWKRVNGW